MCGTLFLGRLFQNHPDSVSLQKYQSLSNQNFKQNTVWRIMPSLDLTPDLSFEPKFRMFISNVYYIKSKRLWFLHSFFTLILHRYLVNHGQILVIFYCFPLVSCFLIVLYSVLVNSYSCNSQITA